MRYFILFAICLVCMKGLCMKIIDETTPAPKGGSVLTIGNFDGVHIGHQALIKATVNKAAELGLPSVVWSFKQHPASIMGDGSFKYVLSAEEKIRQLSKLNPDYYFGADFLSYKEMSAEDFVKNVLVEQFGVKHLLCGFDFSFGKGGKGTPELLKKLLAPYGAEVTVLPEVVYGGDRVSSTRIRALIAKGDVATASRLLGRYYSFNLPVIRGRCVGRTLGAPTINQLFPQDRALPAFGVYAVFCEIDGQMYKGAANIGVRPTVNGGANVPVSETHILDFDGDLYGKYVRIHLYRRLRGEERFSSMSSLSEQIARDAAFAGGVLASARPPKGENDA